MTDGTRHPAAEAAGPIEISDCRIDRDAWRSFNGGERGFWMVTWKNRDGGAEYYGSGVCLDGNRRVQVLFFRDSLGMLAKFIWGGSAVAEAFVKEFGGRMAPSSDGQGAKRVADSSIPMMEE